MPKKQEKSPLAVAVIRAFRASGSNSHHADSVSYISDTLFGIVFAAVAGIMVYISLDELLPTAREYGEHHLSILGFVLGMGVMAFSVLLIF
jgi:zinc transporter ZupT